MRKIEISGHKKGYSCRRGRWGIDRERLKGGFEDWILLGAENPDKRTMVVETATLPIGCRTDCERRLWTFLTV